MCDFMFDFMCDFMCDSDEEDFTSSVDFALCF